MRVLRVMALVLGGALLLCGFIATAELQLHGQDSSVLLLLPTILPLPRTLLAGGDFPDLNFAGVVVVYLVPGAALAVLGYLLPSGGRPRE